MQCTYILARDLFCLQKDAGRRRGCSKGMNKGTGKKVCQLVLLATPLQSCVQHQLLVGLSGVVLYDPGKSIALVGGKRRIWG